MSTAKRVASKVMRLPRGRALSLNLFRECGPAGAVRTALSRLVKAGTLVHLARGVYARPKPSRFYAISLPGAEEVVRCIARSSGEQLAPHGAEVARRMGLTQQAPTQTVYYTTGRTRRLKLGGGEVYFEHAPEALIRNASTPAGRALLAMHHLGREGVTKEVLQQVVQRVPTIDLLHEETSPAWLRSRVSKLINDDRSL